MFNDDWKEIVEIINKTQNVQSMTELNYQIAIENCLRTLGWKSSNGTMKINYKCSQLDECLVNNIVLYSKEENGIVLLPIIIGNTTEPTQNQFKELQSIINDEGLNNAIFWGNTIKLFHLEEEDKDLIEIYSIPFDTDNAIGSSLCDILDYKMFNRDLFDGFCTNLYNQLPTKKKLTKRIAEILSNEKNLLSIIKSRLLDEGFSESDIEHTLSTELFISKLQGLFTKAKSKSQSKENNRHKLDTRDNTKFSIDGKNFYPKKRFVLKVVQQYVALHPSVTIDELERIFPSKIISSERGVIRPLDIVNQWIKTNPDVKTRYCMNSSEIITLKDGLKIVVHNQWGKKHFPAFLKIARTLFDVQSDQVYSVGENDVDSLVKEEDSISKSSIQITKQSLKTFTTHKE